MYFCPECNKKFEYDGKPKRDDILFCPHCNASIVLYETLRPGPGNTVGDFRIIEKIGQGGMGAVFLAEQVSIGRKVALKILSDELVEEKKSIDQFMKEVKTTARLEHPAIVAAIDAGTYQDIYYFAMTYVDGYDLESWLQTRGRLQEDKAVKYAVRIAEALEYAWEKHRLLHRDIKPGNIIISRDDEAFLLDMGIAQHFSETFEKRELIDGSPYYMSPEQTFAEPLSWASDLYSLGASLYHLLTGVAPYDSEDINAIMKMHSAEPFPEPKKRNPHVDLCPATVEMLRRMMGKTPADRFRSWHEFILTARELHYELASGHCPKKLPLVPVEHDPGHDAVGGHPAPRSGRLWVAIAGLAAVAAAVLCSMALIFKIMAERNADRDLYAAENYAEQDEYDYERGVELFGRAQASCSNLLVNGDKLSRAQQGYHKAESLLSRELARRGAFRKGMEEAGKMINELYRMPDFQREEKCLAAEKILAANKPVLESELRKHEVFRKKIAAFRQVADGQKTRD